MHRLDEERAERLQAEHEAKEDAKARQKAEDREGAAPQNGVQSQSAGEKCTCCCHPNLSHCKVWRSKGFFSCHGIQEQDPPVAHASFWLNHCRVPACVAVDREKEAATIQYKP